METLISILITLNTVIASNNPTPTQASVMVGYQNNVTTVRVDEKHDEEAHYLKVNSNGQYCGCCVEGDGF